MIAGTRLGPYEIVSVIGSGGMGEVYAARDTRLDRIVAIKILAADVNSLANRERLQREARAIATLQHPNICAIFDVGEVAAGQSFLVMELLQGETLQQRLAHGPPDLNTAIGIAAAIASALDASHRAGIVHRDIKPANIFLTAHGPKLLDFGLAKSMERNASATTLLTQSGAIVGTVAYMSPEQLRGDPIDARSDIYSLGLVLRDMAPNAPPPFARIIEKSVEVDRGRRYQQASEMYADLRQLMGGGAPAWSGMRRGMLGAAAAVLAALAIAAYWYARPSAAKLTDKDFIVLADFTNTTGEDVFDDTLRQGLTVQLQQSPFLALLSDQKLRKTLALMGQPADAKLTPAIARDICQRTASAAVLEGTLSKLGSRYVLGLRAINCQTGDAIDQEQAQADKPEDVLNALTEMANAFRKRAGESLATLTSHQKPLAEATTASPEALRAYTAGYRAQLAQGMPAAQPFLERAIAIDPSFAMAHGLLGLNYAVLGESERAVASTKRAYALRERTSDPERFFIEFVYSRDVTGNLEKALQTLEVWAATYPRDTLALGLLGGFSTQGTGKFERTLAACEEAIALDPDQTFPYLNIATASMYMNRFDEAARGLQRARDRQIDSASIGIVAYALAFLRGDEAGMAEELARAKSQPDTSKSLEAMQAMVAGRAGQLRKARELNSAAIAASLAASQRERAALYQTATAMWEAFAGNLAAANREAANALAASQGRDVLYGGAFALGLAGGDLAIVQKAAADLEQRLPEDTSVHFFYGPTLRALALLKRGNAATAIEQLQITSTYDQAPPAISFYAFFGAQHPAYIRGLAYRALGKHREAAAEFQKILARRGLVLADPLGAIVMVEKGRALAASGDAAGARTAYDEFIALWKNADPDVPLLAQAKAERARLGAR